MNTDQQKRCYMGDDANFILGLGVSGLVLLFIFLICIAMDNVRVRHHTTGAATINFRSVGSKLITGVEVELGYEAPGTGKVALNIYLE